jgi:long-chain acyl-CoA synthetase
MDVTMPALSLLPVTNDNRQQLAVSDGQIALTWGQLEQRVAQVAHTLRDLGLAERSRFAVLMRNRVTWVEIIFGNLLAGTEYVPVNWHLTPAEIAYLLADSGATLLLHDDANRELAQAAASLADGVTTMDVDGEWENRVASAPATFAPGASAGAVLLYTGGTTGRPKAVIRSEVRDVPLAGFGDFSRSNAIDVWHFPQGPAVHLVVCPLYHAAPPGLMTYSLLMGQRVHILDRFDAEATLAAIEREKITILVVVPTQIIRLLRLPDEIRSKYDLSSLEFVLHGAAPCPQWAKLELIEWFGPIVWEYYGAVEGTGPFLCDSQTFLDRPGTVGKPPANFEVWVEDGDGRRLDVGVVGELWYKNRRGHPVYYNDPTKTSAAVRPDGSYTIGDYGSFDELGNLYIADRRVDMILSGGVNIYPAEIEAALSEHPHVRDVAVIGLDDDEWGQRVHAVVALEVGARMTTDELDQHCRGLLAGFKCPRSYDLVETLPRDESGKLRRQALRQTIITEHSQRSR